MTDNVEYPQIEQSLLQEARNTDKLLWREREDDYYADSVHITEGGGLGIDCGGTVFVMPLKGWHFLAEEALKYKGDLVDELAKALQFYKDAWSYKLNGRYGGLEYSPKEELLEDCGNRASEALTKAKIINQQGE